MILTGALVNGGAIVVGGLLGTFGGKLMPEKMRQTVLGATALVSMGIGISGAIGSSNQLIPILSLVIGAVIGELLHIEDGVTRAGDWLQKKFRKMGPITDGFVSGSLVFAVGAMAVMGSLDSGLKNDHGILLAKSVIDFAGSVAFASSMGIGIVFSGLSVLAVEGVMTLLASLLRERPESSVLVFSRTKHGADRIARILTKAGIEGRAIHGDKSQGARERAMNDFRSGACRVLIATDIAARGIDISELPLVINYDLPEVPETYVHRIGRTGRAGRDGQAIAFCSEEERPLLKDILKLTGLELDPDSGELAPAQNSRKKPAGKKPDTAQTGGQKQAEEKRAAQKQPAQSQAGQRPGRRKPQGQAPGDPKPQGQRTGGKQTPDGQQPQDKDAAARPARRRNRNRGRQKPDRQNAAAANTERRQDDRKSGSQKSARDKREAVSPEAPRKAQAPEKKKSGMGSWLSGILRPGRK